HDAFTAASYRPSPRRPVGRIGPAPTGADSLGGPSPLPVVWDPLSLPASAACVIISRSLLLQADIDPEAAPHTLKLSSQNKSGGRAAKRSSTRMPDLPDRPISGKGSLFSWVLLGLIGVGSFGVTFFLVRLGGGHPSAPSGGPPGMVWIPGGEFTMGT